MKLLLDIGNTRIKSAYACEDNIVAFPSLAYRQTNFNLHLQEQWRTLTQVPDVLVISCVGHSNIIQEISTVAIGLWPAITIGIPKARQFALGVHNAYREPERLGIDRWLALLAVRQICQDPVCVIDCGTAITVDFMAADGRHLGGLISPGLTLMRHALATGTEQLNFSQIQYARGLANHTDAAIYNGVLYAAAGLIEKVLDDQATDYKVFLTGGDAETLASHLNIAVHIEPELVLQGLLAISREYGV